jgi:trehalose synthase
MSLRPVEVRVPAQPLARYGDVAVPGLLPGWMAAIERAVGLLRGRVVWHVNSTARGGGVAEMLGPLIGGARDAGVDARWLVIAGDPEFFAVTKRLHNSLHAHPGDGGDLGEDERGPYERVLEENAVEIEALVRPGDLVVLHDPQTAGLVPHLRRAGAMVVWRCHIGHDDLGHPLVRRGWAFLEPYVRRAHVTAFSRAAYVPPCCDSGRSRILRPAIDPFSPKNQALGTDAARAILVGVGLLEGPSGPSGPVFRREDGSPGRVDRGVDLLRVGRSPAWGCPLVVQVSRWDRLKDHIGVMRGFARLDPARTGDAHLVLAGPTVTGVADDPEGPEVLDELQRAWRELPHDRRRHVLIASLPMADPSENAAIVNALQRHAAVIVQKSLMEGFGLTVTEAMWKGRPVVASAVGGIPDQLRDGTDGVLLDDPGDEGALATALTGLLGDSERAASLGDAARERVRRDFLGIRLLADYAELVVELAG